MALLPVDAALARLLAGVVPTEPETVPLVAAAGRTLADAVIARRTQPPFPASAMDGYALHAADAALGAKLRVVGQSLAGKRFEGAIARGEAVRIFTGAPVPDGADAVLPQESTTADGGAVVTNAALAPGRYLRPAGLDFREGDLLLSAGRRVGPREIALAASGNHPSLSVYKRPRVAVLSVGDELVAPGETPGPDAIVAATVDALCALVASAGGQATDLGIVPDDADRVAAAALAARGGRADVFVTIGGASVGDHDVVRPALATAGMELDFWRIAMRPGMPLVVGRLGAMRVIGLPGNPVSSQVCALLFLVPLVEALQGIPARDRTRPARLGVDVAANDHREEYTRATLQIVADGLPLATPLPKQDSSMLTALVAADCLLIRPANARAEEAGSLCRVLPLP